MKSLLEGGEQHPENGPWLLVGRTENWRIFARRLARDAEVECCPDAETAAHLLRRARYHSTIVEWIRSASLGGELCSLARDTSPQMPFMALTAPAAVLDRVHALEAGVDDCIAYDTDVSELLARMRAVARRRRYSPASDPAPKKAPKLSDLARAFRLSKREQEVLALMASGVHPKEIGPEIGCNYSTVRTHLRRVCRKLGCSGTREAIIRYFEFGVSPHTVYPNGRLVEERR